MIKIVIASDSFKGSLSSLEVGQAAVRAIRKVIPNAKTEIVPVADGGEGTVEAVVDCLGGRVIHIDVTGPLGEPVKASYGICGDTAVIEMAAASGLTLVPEEKRNPWITTTYGTGELIRDALIKGCRKFLIGLGGSATNDAGIGMLRALGFRFLDKNGNEVGNGGGEAERIIHIDTSNVLPQLADASFTVACDVNNPLTGPNGASYIFGPQKGADSKMVQRLDAGMSSFACVASKFSNNDYSSHPGAGAAGGLGFAFLTFLNAHLEPGIEMVLDAVDFNHRIEDATLVITGEGRLDHQTIMGKTPYGVLQRSKAYGIPVIAIGGAVLQEAVPTLMDAGFLAVFPIVAGPTTLKEALQHDIASKNVERTVGQIIRALMTSLPHGGSQN